MSDDTEDQRPRAPEPTQIPLEGPGPFQLPICTDLKDIGVGESLAVLRFETLDHQRIDIPIPIGMLVEIGDACEEALQHAIKARDGGSTVQ